MRFALVWLLSLMVLVTAKVLASSEEDFGKIPDTDWQIVAPSESPEAGAVIIFKKAEMLIKSTRIEIDYHVRIKYLTQAGIEEAGERSIYYWPKWDKFKSFKGCTYTPDGQKHKVENNAKFEKDIGDLRELTFTFPALEPGAIVEYRYQINSERFFWLQPWYFHDDLYVMKSQFVAALTPGFAYDIDYFNIPGPQREPVESTRPNPEGYTNSRTIKCFTWTMTDLPQIKDEPYMAAINDYRAKLQFHLTGYRTATAWQQFDRNWLEEADRFEKWIEDYVNQRGEIKQLALEAVGDASTDREKSEAIYRYVTSQYKSTSELHVGWFGQGHVSDLLSQRQGPGEAKNLLLVEMHKALGIPCWPVVISTRSNGKFEPTNPDLRQFNYMIAFVQLGNDWEFLDAADRLTPYGMLAGECLTDGGLLIDGGNSDLVKIQIKPRPSSRIDYTFVEMDENGAARCSTQCVASGYYAADMARDLEESEEVDFVKSELFDRLDLSYTIDSESVDLDDEGRLTITAVFHSDELCRHLDENVIVRPAQYAFAANPFQSQDRHFPVDFAYPRIYHTTTCIKFGESCGEIQLPEDLKASAPGATFTRKSQASGRIATVTTLLEITNPVFEPVKYHLLRDLFDRIAASCADEVIASGTL